MNYISTFIFESPFLNILFAIASIIIFVVIAVIVVVAADVVVFIVILSLLMHAVAVVTALVCSLYLTYSCLCREL